MNIPHNFLFKLLYLLRFCSEFGTNSFKSRLNIRGSNSTDILFKNDKIIIDTRYITSYVTLFVVTNISDGNFFTVRCSPFSTQIDPIYYKTEESTTISIYESHMVFTLMQNHEYANYVFSEIIKEKMKEFNIENILKLTEEEEFQYSTVFDFPKKEIFDLCAESSINVYNKMKILFPRNSGLAIAYPTNISNEFFNDLENFDFNEMKKYIDVIKETFSNFDEGIMYHERTI